MIKKCQIGNRIITNFENKDLLFTTTLTDVELQKYTLMLMRLSLKLCISLMIKSWIYKNAKLPEIVNWSMKILSLEMTFASLFFFHKYIYNVQE